MSKTTAPFMHATDVNPEDDFAGEMVGVSREEGLYLLTETSEPIHLSLEVQQQVYDALGDFLETVG